MAIVLLAVTGRALEAQIPIADAMEAIRFFRSLAIDTANNSEMISFCQIREAFGTDGRLKRSRDRAPVPFESLTECERARADTTPANGVYFDSVVARGDSLVFKATRIYGKAISTQEYIVVRAGNSPRLRVSFSILLAKTS